MSITGDPDGEPMKVGVALVDVLSGLFATVGILTALRHRDRTGEGQLVEVDLFSALLAAMVNQGSAYTIAGVVPQRLGNQHPSISPYEVYATGEGELVLAVGNDRQFAALCEVIGAPTSPPTRASPPTLPGSRIESRWARSWSATWRRARRPSGAPSCSPAASPPGRSTTSAPPSSSPPRSASRRRSRSRARTAAPSPSPATRSASPPPPPPTAQPRRCCRRKSNERVAEMPRRVCVFAGSSVGTDPAFLAAAHELGGALAGRGLGLVFGATGPG